MWVRFPPGTIKNSHTIEIMHPSLSRFALPCAFFYLLSAVYSASGEPSRDAAQWKKEIANGCLPYHRLVAEDFPVSDADRSPQGMYTYGFRHYNYHWVAAPNGGRSVARVTNWTVRYGFDRNKSWRKSWFKQVKETLPHEQGHLDISVLHSVPFARMSLDKLPVGEGENAQAASNDLKNKLEALVNRVSQEAQAEQDAYDAATSHGTNQAKQREWTAAIQKRLDQAGVSY